jgi:hypothetical protein
VLAPNTRHINITGTNTINSFNIDAGMCYFVKFSGVMTITNNAFIITNKGANILTASGDTCIIRATDFDVVELIAYEEAVQGSTGATELQGILFNSSTVSTADSDPGNGVFKWNNSTQSSATVLYFDSLTSDAVDVSTFFSTFTTGQVQLQQGTDSTKWQMWNITGVTTTAGYYKLDVTLLAYGGQINDAQEVFCLFIPYVNPAIISSTLQRGEVLTAFNVPTLL